MGLQHRAKPRLVSLPRLPPVQGGPAERELGITHTDLGTEPHRPGKESLPPSSRLSSSLRFVCPDSGRLLSRSSRRSSQQHFLHKSLWSFVIEPIARRAYLHFTLSQVAVHPVVQCECAPKPEVVVGYLPCLVGISGCPEIWERRIRPRTSKEDPLL
ncbi:hypothetical protein VTG60DRAFT_3912 [Thermothelomyces hinnuleus]